MYMISYYYQSVSHVSLAYDERRILKIINSVSPKPPTNLREYTEALGRLESRYFSLFDYNHDGRISFEEFLDLQWARLLWFHRSGDGRVSLEDAVKADLGPWDPNATPKENAFRRAGARSYIKSLDRSLKGYLIRDDLREQARDNFKMVDKAGRGYFTREDVARGRI